MPGLTRSGCKTGRSSAVGSDEEVSAALPDAAAVDLNAALVLPGFIDAHFHTLMTGEALLRADLLPAKTWQTSSACFCSTPRHFRNLSGCSDAVGSSMPCPAGGPLQRCSTKSSQTDQSLSMPTTITRPGSTLQVFVHWASPTRRRTQQGVGSRVTPTGKATGFLEETAAETFAWAYLESMTSDEQRLTHLRSAIEHLNASGVTGVIDMGLNAAALKAMAQAEEEGWLNVRVVAHWLMSREGTPADHLAQVAEAAELAQRHGSDRLRVAGIKFIVDGVIDGCTAHVSAPYTNGDMPEPIWDYDALAPVVAAADAAGLQCALHAIGDGAVRTALNADRQCCSGQRDEWVDDTESSTSSTSPLPMCRAFADLGVTASMQPVHCDPAIQQNWRQMLGPERSARGYPGRELVEAGARLVLGTDAPTAPYAPLPNMFIAATRRSAFDLSLSSRTSPSYALPLDDAISYATAHAAWSCFDEGKRGMIRPGLAADFTVIEPDVLAGEPEALLNAEVRAHRRRGPRGLSRGMIVAVTVVPVRGPRLASLCSADRSSQRGDRRRERPDRHDGDVLAHGVRAGRRRHRSAASSHR